MQLERYRRTYKLLQSYLSMDFGRARIACPYWVNRNLHTGDFLKGPFSGKGTPGQIVSAALKKANRNDFDISKAKRQDVLAFLKNEKIGVDCSGFVFHIANTLDKERGGNGIADEIVKDSNLPHWRKAWRANAAHITSDDQTVNIALEDVAVGDLIRLSGGKHVMIIVDVDRVHKTITYAHSSRLLTKVNGVHLGKISITSWRTPLQEQRWEEVSTKGVNLSTHLKPELGDGIKRFKWWNTPA